MQITELLTRVSVLPAGSAAILCVIAATIAHAAHTPTAATGRIEGIVRLAGTTTASLVSGAYPSRRVARPAGSGPEVGNVIVFVKDAPLADTLPVVRARMIQKEEAFQPRVLAITRGSTVEFPNVDPYFHNVFSLSRGATFDLGRYPRGESRARTFTRTGLVKVYCHIHSHMSASIMVFDHPHFGMPAADGSFTLDGVPAGSLTLSAWHERIGESARRIVVQPGETTRVEFVLPVEDR